MQKLPDFVPALSHHFKPVMGEGSQFAGMVFHPRIDSGVAFDSAVESQQFRFHRSSILQRFCEQVFFDGFWGCAGRCAFPYFSIPQGLKPSSSLWVFSARLKPCPVTKLACCLLTDAG